MGRSLHPCQSCGACCAFFRVSFYWREAEEAAEGREAPVPRELTEDRNALFRVMKGTNDNHHVRCVALEGKVGESVACGIYALRPSPCRDFQASFEDGTHEGRCDSARAKYHLRPLSRRDWAPADSPGTILEHENHP
jgi:Fe-S-cluster containining protein